MSSGIYMHSRFLDRAKLAWRGIKASGMFALTGAWEGGERDRRRNRPVRRMVAQDTDLDLGVREDLMSEARDLCQKFSIAKRILRQFPNYVVGSGRVQWMTDSDTYNEEIEGRFAEWSKLCDYRGLGRSLRRMARLAVMSKKRDGDVFVLEHNDDGLYTLEPIEADRVGNIYGQANIDQGRYVGGVKLDAAGRPVAYRVSERDNYGNFKNPVDVPAFRMIHFWDTDRFDSYRGVTAFHAVLNSIRDLKESKTAEQLKQKLGSKLALLVKNASGGTQQLPGINLFGDDTTNSGASVKTEEVGDLAIQYMFNGDEMKAFLSESPHDSWFRLSELLIREIAVGLDLPFEFVWNMATLTGPGTRMMSKQAERTFVQEQNDLDEMFYDRVITRWMANEVAEGRLAFSPQMLRFSTQRPSHPSIDAGRESAANMAEHARGVLSGQDIAKESGRDIFDIHAQRERESRSVLTRAKALAAEFGIGLELALGMMTDAGKLAAAAPPPEPAESEPPAKEEED